MGDQLIPAAAPEPSTGLGPGRSRPLREALDRAWAALADDYGLLPDLAFDAVMARAAAGELVAATPRLLELVVGHRTTVGEAATAVTLVASADRPSPEHRAAVFAVLDAWWLETLGRLPGELTPPFGVDAVLGVICGAGAPMVRWLGPWLDALDGPGAVHLAGVVIGGPDGLSGPAWIDKSDEARQVLAWARTEPVVNGLTLVGGVHLDDGVLGRALDRLIT